MYTSVSLARRAGGVKARRGVAAGLPRGLGATSLCYTLRITCAVHVVGRRPVKASVSSSALRYQHADEVRPRSSWSMTWPHAS